MTDAPAGSPLPVAPTYMTPVAPALAPRDRLLVAAISLVALLPGTMGVSLVDRDEGWYAQVSREMLAGGDWLIPHYLGQPWIAKPPLLYWCVAGAFRVFGLHAWVARLVPVVAMASAVQVLVSLANELAGRRAAWIAACVFITAGLPAVVGKMLLTDPLLLLCCLGASMCLWRCATRGATLARSGGFWLLGGLALLAKGPAVVVFVGGFVLGLLALGGKRTWLGSPRFWLVAPVSVVVAAPWYAYAASHAGGTLWQQFFGYEIASRFTGTPHGHGGPPGYYVLLSLVGWLPWTALVPGAVLETWRARRGDRAAWLLLIWCGLPWVFLELIHSKLPHYILPCYVPLAIMLGRKWDTMLAAPIADRRRRALRVWVAVPIVLGALLVMAAAAYRGSWSWPLGAAGVALVASFVLVGAFVQRGNMLFAWRAAVCGTALFHVIGGVWLLPALEPYRLSRNIAERANALSGPASDVLVCGYTEPTLFFYLRRPARIVDPQECTQPAPRAVVIARDPELRAAGIDPERDTRWQRVRGFNYVKGRDETVWLMAADSAGQPSR